MKNPDEVTTWGQESMNSHLKFIYSEKATKFCETLSYYIGQK